MDLNDSLIDDGTMVSDDLLRFKEGRDGDHLMTPFQCDTCHFVNIQRRLPVHGCPQDDLLLLTIRRVTLDSLWSRERGSVRSNRLEGLRLLKHQVGLNMSLYFLPVRGPHPKEDAWGVATACCMVQRSLDPGRNSKMIQYETVRKMRSFVSNLHHASLHGTGATFVSNEGTSSRISNAVTNSLWFQRFMTGMHKRMGDVWIPDRAISQYEMNCCFKVLESRWEMAFEIPIDDYSKKRVSTTACILLAGYFAGLRGEEINRVDLGAMNQHWEESASHPHYKHIPLMLSGTFKREVGLKYFCQPLALKTEGGREIGVWFQRLMSCRSKEGCTTGPMFAGDKGNRMPISEMDELFHEVLLEVQRQFPSVIPDKVDVKGDYSTFRSLRRGATSEAQNARIPQEVIEANNRWRKFSRLRGMRPAMSMMEHYSDAKVGVPSLIRFSASLPG